ncbi:MAG: excinuclease ABC subunit UvrA [Candidatus Aminicenantes bacterium]|jgi:excinuclease ABC subunit A|nr:excinuclease ABC subunit UvrA [Candidatus Aminicenantes bacterium]
MIEEIRVKKAAQHNLKRIDISLPRNKLIVITGPSGSGKSSLAFDTLYAEGQRRYIACLSAYARQYIEQMEKPEMESIEGVSPSISIDQRTISSNPRSTVGTVTEIYDFLRLLFARVGSPHCPRCGRKVSSQTPQQILKRIFDSSSGEKVKILSPVVKGRKGEYQRLFEKLRKKGFLRFRVDGQFREVEEEILLKKTKKHNIDILIDEIKVSSASERRLKEAVDKALEIASGDLLLIRKEGKEIYYSLNLLCPFCEISLPELEPRNFSFNSPYGACPRCHGLGFETVLDMRGKVDLTDEVCPLCEGGRLKKESLAVKVGDWNIYELTSLPVGKLTDELFTFKLSPTQELIASRIQKEILSRLEIMVELGMPYIQLSRTTASLSGGEARRLRLAAQVGARLRGILYVLDEPTIGLHQRDNRRLISLLREIRDQENSIIVVEHDEQTIRSADFILDLGPGAGEEGGFKVVEGNLDLILSSPVSLTAKYLRGEKCVLVPLKRRKPKGWLVILKAAEHNLKNIDARIPISVMTGVTGVSGSGKSTLIYDILFKRLLNIFYKAKQRPGKHKAISGIDQINKVVSVDQKAIGRTPRSNPATYTGLFTPLRQLFSRVPESRMRGYSASRFSFNIPGGRCEECRGAGVRKIEMHFLPDVFVTCDRCGGKRYNTETLSVRYKGNNIADYLDMTVDEAYEYLKVVPILKRKLGTLKKVGLGYIRLGQQAPTISGGEAQRIKLTKELSRKDTGKTLYLLDEPTTGLHFDDVRKLLEVLSELVELGNTVVIIEHNLDVIKYCDYIIDLGPEGGEEGGWIVAQGVPEKVAEAENSHTGRFLKRVFTEGKPIFE